MSIMFPNTFAKAAEANIDHSRFWANFYVLWVYTIIDFWIVVALGAAIFGVVVIFVPLSALGGWFLGTSLAIYVTMHHTIGLILRKAQKAFVGQSEKDVSDVPFATGAVLVLISILHLGFLIPNVALIALT